MKKYLVLLVILVSALFLSAYAIRDDIEVEDDWYMNYIDPDRAVAYDSLIYLFMLKGGGAYDTVRITDTLCSVTFFADTGFNVRSRHINMGNIATNSVTGLLSFASGWDDTVIGVYSFAFGRGNKITATGGASGIWGLDNYINVGYSACWGFNDTVNAAYSACWGNNNNVGVSGDASGIWGTNNVAGGVNGAVWGNHNTIYASADDAGILGGVTNQIRGDYSICSGESTLVNAKQSFVIGYRAKIQTSINTDSCDYLFGTGIIDSICYGFLIGDNVADILDRPHTFSVMLDTNDLNGYTEIGDSVVIDQDGDVWGIDTCWANYFIGHIVGGISSALVKTDSLWTNFINVRDSTAITIGNDVAMTNNDITGINVASGDTADFTIIEGDKVNTGFFFQELLQHWTHKAANSGASNFFYGGFTTLSPDSIVFDSLRVIWYTNHNDVYIDSVSVARGITRTTNDATVLMGDGTNYGAGSTGYVPVTYSINQTISFDWRLLFTFWVATSATAGAGNVYSAKVYGHYN